MRERARYLRGMTAWIGFTQTAVPYTRDARYAGETKYPLRKMVRFALDAIVSFSHTPLQLASIIGFWVAALSFAAIPVAVAMRIAGQFVPGVTSVALAVLILGGLQLMALGVIGEYVGRIYDEVKQRPLYVVGKRINFDEDVGVRIAIVGAGVTGLVAGRLLGRAGHQVTVYERWPGLGGQAATLDVGQGHLLERYYHHWFTSDVHILQLCKELGLSDTVEWHDSKMAFFVDGRSRAFVTPSTSCGSPRCR